MSGILVIGAGGHARVVADILLAGGHSVRGFLDDNPDLIGSAQLGLPILGRIDQFADFSPDGLVIAMGSNRLRKEIALRLGPAAAYLWRSAIHPRAVISPFAQIGAGAMIAAGVVVNPSAILGEHVIINTSASVDHDCVVGAFAHVAPGARLTGGVTLDEGAFIGAGAIVIPARNVGAWSMVGAGAVVVRDVPSRVVAKGIPARW